MATKADLAEELRKPGLSYRDASVYIDTVINAIKKSLINGNTVELRGFGTFYIAKRAERKTSLNGQISIPEHGKIYFRPCDKLRKAVWDVEPAN